MRICRLTIGILALALSATASIALDKPAVPTSAKKLDGSGLKALYDGARASFNNLQNDVPLISLCQSRQFRPIPLGSKHVFGTLPSRLRLAPDAGRKLLENDLRELKASAGDIDAVLRHEVKLQAKHSLGVDFQLSAWAQRVVPLLDTLAKKYFFWRHLQPVREHEHGITELFRYLQSERMHRIWRNPHSVRV